MANLDRSIVAGLGIFDDWKDADVDSVLVLARAARYAKGDNVFVQGEDATSFFLLLNGHLQVSKLNADGNRVVLRYINPGEMFGLAVQMSRHSYPATARAVVESLALVWPSSSWAELVGRFPQLVSHVMVEMGSRLSDAQARMTELTSEGVEQRVARTLLRLIRQAGRQIEAGTEIDFPITRQDLAEMTGTTLFSVSRILSAWEAEGLIGGGRQRIVIRAPAKLAQLADTKPE